METHKLETLPEGDAILLGRGRLTWNRGERVSDRYGFVYLLKSGDSMTATCEYAELFIPEGKPEGKLLARVTDPRTSTHIGDFFRGLSPRTPNCGDIFLLGEGRAVKDGEEPVAVGIEPLDGRHSDRLNPRALYDCH